MGVLNFECLLVIQVRILSKELDEQIWNLGEKLGTELAISQVSAIIQYLKS